MKLTTFALTLLTATVSAAIKPKDIQPERELLITNIGVVDSEHARYPGVWSFGTLMNQLADEGKGAGLTRVWLDSMAAVQFVQGQRIKARHGWVGWPRPQRAG